jgi:hypothetical protein
LAAGLVLLLISLQGTARAEIGAIPTGSFSVEHVLVLPGTPDAIYDAATGDIAGWWDHSFSDAPLRLYIEPKPGGGFWEIFDEAGDGARHAVVLAAERPKMLRFEGPLGLSGAAIQMVTTYTLDPVGADSTRFTVSVRASGEVREGWADAVDRTWAHFLFDRFRPYVEGGMRPLR